jgi:hypothetical protein
MPSSKPVLGVNDLQSQFAEIAAEAYGWDPSTVTAGSNQKKDWKCNEGHIYSSMVNNRTKGRGCPICAGQQVLVGFNDLKTKYPDIAAQAFGWDPSKIGIGTHRKLEWIGGCGHIWTAEVKSRTLLGSGCPICAGQQVLVGFNDLKTKYPDIAAEAYQWDPQTVTNTSGRLRQWKGGCGHIWNASVSHRTTGDTKCPYCSGRQVLAGFNDLKTKYPDIAAEAYGWNPETVTAGAKIKQDWECREGHIYSSVVHSRTGMRTGCPICAGQQVLVGFNDLKTKYPDIAAEAYEWDPTSVTANSGKKKKWKCNYGHIWKATTDSRTLKGSGCPICAEHGFNPGKDAWFYLMGRPGEQQFGITNDKQTRIKKHERNGWVLIEIVGPAFGQWVLTTETILKKWLKKEVGLMEGTTENWSTTSMEVQSLAELKARSGIETDLF